MMTLDEAEQFKKAVHSGGKNAVPVAKEILSEYGGSKLVELDEETRDRVLSRLAERFKVR